MHFPRLITVWLTLLGATLFPLSSKSWEGDGKPLWPDGTVELNLLLGDAPTYSNSSTPNDNARLAIEAWNPNMKRLQLVALAASTGPALFGNARNDVSFGTTAGGDPIPEDALAVTLIRIDGGVRVEADAVINSNQSWGVYDGYRSRTDYDIRSTLLHEFGHLLGLDHPDEAGQEYVSAVMRSDYSDSYYSNTPLYADDKDGVGALYGFTEVNPSRPPEVHTTLHPKDLEVGEYLQYSVSVTGAQPLSFQWFKNGLPMPGQTASNLLIEPVGLSDAGEYYVEVTNRVGGDSSNTGRVTVRVPDPPMFRDEGGKREVVVGADTTLAFGYTGSDPFTFQWFKDGQPIPGATEEWLSLRRLTATDGGDYQVEISNVSGSVLSPILAVVIMPEPPPVFTTYAPPAPIVLFPGDELSISPSYEGYYGDREFSFQWYHDGVPLSGETESTLRLPYAVDLVGDYHLVMRNVTGATTSDPYRVEVRPMAEPPLGGWTARAQLEHMAYFLFENPARIERFNLSRGEFDAPLALPQSAQTFAIHDGFLYYATGPNLRRMRPDGTGDEALLQGTGVIAEIFGLGDFVYVVLDETYPDIIVFNLTTRVVQTMSGGYDLNQGFSTAPQRGKFFALSRIGSPNRPSSVSVSEDGTFRLDPQVAYHGNLPGATRTWVMPGENEMVADSGIIHRTDDLSMRGFLGAFADLALRPDRTLLALRGIEIDRFSDAYVQLDSYRLAQPADGIAVHGERVFVFRQPTGLGQLMSAEEVPLANFGAPPVGPASDPGATDLPIETVLQDRRGHLILHSPLLRSMFVWSVAERRFLANLPLRGAAVSVVYSPVWDKVVIGYANGVITTISLAGSDRTERTFTRAPVRVQNLAAVGNHLLLVDPSGGNSAHYTFDVNGDLVDRAWNAYPSRSFVWSESLRRVFHFRDGISPNDLLYTPIGTDGTMGDDMDSPYHGGNYSSPIVLSPSEDHVLIGSGIFYNARTLEQTNQLEQELVAGVWLGNRVYTARYTVEGLRLTRWGGPNYQADAETLLTGYNPRLFAQADGTLVLTSMQQNRFVVSVFDADLNPISRMTHRGVDLLADGGRISNLSTRVQLAEEEAPLLIVGFVVEGTEPLPVLIRAVGPGLTTFGVTDLLADPQLRLFNAQRTLIDSNDNWSTRDATEIAALTGALGAFALDSDSADAALLANLAPGAYTAQADGVVEASGNVLLEVYDASDGGADARLVNLSTRVRTGVGANALIAGFVFTGETPKQLLLRGVGPSLSEFGVVNLLPDPVLTVRQAEEVRGANDDWDGSQAVQAATSRVGAFPLQDADSRDAALVANLEPGVYTAEVTSGADEEAGEALVEIYQIDP